VFEGGGAVTLSANVRGTRSSPTNDCWRHGVACVILGVAILVEHRLLTDRRTHDDGKYRVSIASRG